jgi:hypothetical protein
MSAPLSVSRRLLSVEEYHKIGEAGVLGEDDRIELIDGEMIEMAPIGSRHVAKVNRFARLLSRSVGEQAIISIQNPIALPPHNEPQPDIALLKPRADDYETKLPGAEDVLLIIEIADTGPGMPPEVQARAFEAFYTTKDVGKGAGLGLDISRRIIVERHHGQITIDSRPGATMLSVQLPHRRSNRQ